MHKHEDPFPIRLSSLVVLAEVDEAEFRFVAETIELARTDLGISAEPIEQRIPLFEKPYMDQRDA